MSSQTQKKSVFKRPTLLARAMGSEYPTQMKHDSLTARHTPWAPIHPCTFRWYQKEIVKKSPPRIGRAGGKGYSEWLRYVARRRLGSLTGATHDARSIVSASFVVSEYPPSLGNKLTVPESTRPIRWAGLRQIRQSVLGRN